MKADAKIIGVNNRDLRDFSVDLNTSLKLAKLMPDSVIKISESGIHSASDVKLLADNGFDAVLIGEQLMKQKDTSNALKELKNYEN